jgi:hypothetical protein
LVDKGVADRAHRAALALRTGSVGAGEGWRAKVDTARPGAAALRQALNTRAGASGNGF